MNMTAAMEARTNKPLTACTDQEIYLALLDIVREQSAARVRPVTGRKLYYISAEFLIGKLLSNNLINLGLYDDTRAALAAAGLVCAALLTASITETNIMSAQGESSYATYNQNGTINSVGTAEYLIDGASSYEAIWAQPKPASGDLHLISYEKREGVAYVSVCLLYTSPSPRD